MCDQDEAKSSDGSRDWKPIWAWEFCPFVVPLMELLLMFHPMFHKSSSVFDHIRPLMPIEIHSILQIPITSPKFLKPVKCCFGGDQWLSNSLLCKNCLHVWTGNDFHDVLCLQETFLRLLLHLQLDFLCNIFIINNCASFPVQLMEGEVSSVQEPHHPSMDVLHVVCSMSLHLGHEL